MILVQAAGVTDGEGGFGGACDSESIREQAGHRGTRWVFGRVLCCSRPCGMPGLEGSGRDAVLIYRSNAALDSAFKA
jgi:hypothetical protein